jgi:hypothetical protein
MCTSVFVTENDTREFMTAPGNPHLIWDGAEARVVSEDFYDALHATSPWLLIICRDDLADMDPEALTYHPAALADMLTIFGDDLAADGWPCRCLTAAS